MLQNLEKIHPLKKEMVAQICNLPAQYPVIRKIIIFGSSVTDECTEDSDIDVYLDLACDLTDEDARNINTSIGRITDYNVDILYSQLIGERLRTEIFSKGVVIWGID